MHRTICPVGIASERTIAHIVYYDNDDDNIEP